MNESTPSAATQRESLPAEKPATDTRPRPARAPSIIVGLVIAAVAGLSIWYLVRPEPLLVQGEVDATRFDIAARVDGRVGEIPVERGQDVAAGAVLVKIDNPETVAKQEQAVAAKIVADAQLANIKVGTRAEVIAAKKAALERAQASVVLAQKTYDRTSQLAEHGNAPIARLDQATDSLHESQRAVDQAKSAYEQAVNGYTKEEHEIAEASVGKALADIKAVQSIIDQMVVYAPVASQVYKRNVEPGEYVSPGVPLVTLIASLHCQHFAIQARGRLGRHRASSIAIVPRSRSPSPTPGPGPRRKAQSRSKGRRWTHDSPGCLDRSRFASRGRSSRRRRASECRLGTCPSRAGRHHSP